MKLWLTRVEVIEVRPARGAPMEHASPAAQLVAFRAALQVSIAAEIADPRETADGDWEYTLVEPMHLQVILDVPEPLDITDDDDDAA